MPSRTDAMTLKIDIWTSQYTPTEEHSGIRNDISSVLIWFQK